MSIFEEADAVTVAYAINAVSGIMGGDRNRCKTSRKSTDMIPY